MMIIDGVCVSGGAANNTNSSGFSIDYAVVTERNRFLRRAASSVNHHFFAAFYGYFTLIIALRWRKNTER